MRRRNNKRNFLPFLFLMTMILLFRFKKYDRKCQSFSTLSNRKLSKLQFFYLFNHWISKAWRWSLCISTSKQVLCMPFAGQNQFFDTKTTFCVVLSHKMYKIMQKINKNHVLKGGLPVFRCYSWMLVDTQTLVDSWEKSDF